MRSRPSRHLPTAIAIAALVLSLAGVSYAALRVDSRAIVNGTVRSVDLRDGGVRGQDVADGSIGGGDVADGSIAGNDLAARSITDMTVAPDALGGAAIDESALAAVPDADRLDGLDSNELLRADAKAADAERLDGRDANEFLGAGETAADSASLGGIPAREFPRGNGVRLRSFSARIDASANTRPRLTLVSLPGFLEVAGICDARAGTSYLQLTNRYSEDLVVWTDDGGTNASVNVTPPNVDTRSVAMAAAGGVGDRLVWQVAAPPRAATIVAFSNALPLVGGGLRCTFAASANALPGLG